MLASDEEIGRRPRAILLLNGLRETLISCGLLDLGMVGYPYTWEHNHWSNMWQAERLDRAVTNIGWTVLFTTAWGIEYLHFRVLSL